MATNWPSIGHPARKHHRAWSPHGGIPKIYAGKDQNQQQNTHRAGEKIIRVSIEYAEATRRGPTPAQMWQKLESIESLVKSNPSSKMA